MKLFKNESGAVVVLMALSMTVLIGLTALVIDGGSLYLEKSRMQKAMDAAVLAGAQELPARPDLAQQQALQIASSNGIKETEVTISITEGNTKIHAYVEHQKQLTFARALGFTEPSVQAGATVQLQPLTSARGVIPLGVDVSQHLSYGDPVVMKAGDASNGNFGALALSGSGAKLYRDDLQTGYQEWLTVGDVVDTQTGNLVGPTQQGLEERFADCESDGTAAYYDYPPNCSRVVLVPVYKPLQTKGNQIKQVEVVGFASFFIERVGSSNEGAEVIGRFIQTAYSGPVSAAQGDFGTYGYKLIE